MLSDDDRAPSQPLSSEGDPVVEEAVPAGPALPAVTEQDAPDDDVVPAGAPASVRRGRRRRRKRPSSPVRSAIEWVLVIAGALLVAFLIRTFLLAAFYIPSASMLSTLEEGDRVLVNKLSYKLHDVNRGDIVVFERPPSEPDNGIVDYIKRVIALPGETVEGRDGRVVVNGRYLNEPYLDEGTVTSDFAPQTIPPDHVFVMGDNREVSVDSRTFDAIPIDGIVGRAFVTIWPLSHLGFL
jgi:signal peptidase I